MSTITKFADLGKIWIPEKSVSYAERAIRPKKSDIFVSMLYRPMWSQKNLFSLPDIENPNNSEQEVKELLAPFKKEFSPESFKSSLIWADIGANERVDKGAEINVTRLFGAIGGISTAGGILTAIAVASANITVAHADLALGSGSAPPQNEFATIGLTRAAATAQNYVAAASLDATASVDLYKSFSISGSGTAYGAGLFDSTTASGSFLFVEKLFSNGSAPVASADTLQITITITL